MRKAQEQIREELRGKTREEELAYWAEQERKLAERQEGVKREAAKKRPA